MLGFFENSPFGFIVFNQGWLCLRWEILAPISFVLIILIVRSFVVGHASRTRIRELNQDQETLNQRFRQVGEQLREMDISLRPALIQGAQQAHLVAGEGDREVPRLRLNDDGSITEYS